MKRDPTRLCWSCFTTLSNGENNQSCPICSEVGVCKACGIICENCGQLVCEDCIKKVDDKKVCLMCYYNTDSSDEAYNKALKDRK